MSVIASFAGLGALIVWKTGFLDNLITNQLVIVNETKVYDMWSRPPVHPLHYIYLFNYTNIDDFREGRADKLKVDEIGPYVYRQTLRKVNVQFHHENGTVSFQRHSNFQFVPELTVGLLNDTVIAPNLVLLGAVNELLTRNYLMQFSFSMIVQNIAPSAFMTLPVEEFLWGYEDTLFDMAKTYGGLKKEVPFDRMALMAGPQILSVYTGVTDISQLDVMAEFNGLTELSIWEGECNQISGSEGTMFPPPVIQAGEDISVYR
ncbi:hypothetical protein B566_EDAN012499 [Ephemera danica]|nr:hypothetical protein B566_EDAN012499 [Ephemera danica]